MKTLPAKDANYGFSRLIDLARTENVKKRAVFTKYEDQAGAVLDALLAKYQDEGVLNLDDPRVLQIAPFTTLGTATKEIEYRLAITLGRLG